MFISFEGIEGLGKTTQIKRLTAYLNDKGFGVVVTREPGGTQMGEEIRDVLLAHRHEVVTPMTELLLMFAARAQHVATIIKPALKQGSWVLCDRFLDASYAYQGGGRGMDLAKIQSLDTLVLEKFAPDLTLLFDADPQIGFQRIEGRGGHPDRFELEKIEFFQRVRSVYLERAKQQPNRFRVIDASKSMEEVWEHVKEIVDKLFVGA
jgi:dTMP kinase